MKRFITNIKRYFKYAVYSAKADLKSEVAGSYLNWLWWILDPLCFMMIYIFVASVVFKSSEPYFPVFIFIGLTVWDFFNKTVNASVKIVSNNRGIVTKIYIPKYILILQKTFVNMFKMMISWLLVFGLMIICKVPFQTTFLWFIPLLIIPMSKAPKKIPTTAPFPPLKDTPPIAQAAIASVSKAFPPVG